MTNNIQQADDGQPFDLSNLEQMLEAGRAITPQASIISTPISSMAAATKEIARLKEVAGSDNHAFQTSIRQLYNRAADGKPRAPQQVIQLLENITRNFAHKTL